MRISKNIWFYIVLAGTPVIFLIVWELTHIEFLLHLAAIPLEVLLAILICAIVIIGGSLLFIRGKSMINLQEQYRAALQITAQKLEEVKTLNYLDIPVGETQENYSLDDDTYTRKMVVEDMGIYKKIKVTVFWIQMGSEREVSLDSFKALQ